MYVHNLTLANVCKVLQCLAEVLNVTHNPLVHGSSPCRPTNKIKDLAEMLGPFFYPDLQM